MLLILVNGLLIKGVGKPASKKEKTKSTYSKQTRNLEDYAGTLSTIVMMLI